ncbi:hypothetical protein FE810_09550 [Thalassotalea litorea]|uniref:DUF11 domain-containing protein n=1 Tax=Thalassotalea litorea TaxID=2020715 RepID=A0A5R9IPL4_9GAMM|nr:hypothetical protein [Thalassotalea litorea]TLU65156.1 hypothetical protein FE810_09550 [Thalassotalea litorea]
MQYLNRLLSKLKPPSSPSSSKTNRKQHFFAILKLFTICICLVFLNKVHAIDIGNQSGFCMEDRSDLEGISSLTCRANDIQIADASNIQVKAIDGDTNHPFVGTGRCVDGLDVTFSADFEVLSTAQERYDIGLYFNKSGGSSARRALDAEEEPGFCQIYTLTDDGVDLDSQEQIGDICNDAEGKTNYFHTVELTTLCTDTDGDDQLNLPNCVSWRQSGANEVCTSTDDTYPGSPSKCNCDDEFNVNIIVPASIDVEKTVSPLQQNEGDTAAGDFEYTIKITNPSSVAVDIQSIFDDKFGDLKGIECNITTVPARIDDSTPGEAQCTFTKNLGLQPLMHTNEVTVSGKDKNGIVLDPVKDDATAKILDVLPTIDVIKTVSTTSDGTFSNSVSIPEPGGTVYFKVEVENTSNAADTLTLTTIEDKIGESLRETGCDVSSVVLAPGQKLEVCTFSASFTGNFGDSETDTVKVTGKDEENNETMDQDSATVTLTDTDSTIDVTKTAIQGVDGNKNVNESADGVDVTFEVKVKNTSSVDSVTINVLEDDIFGDLNNKGSCLVPFTLGPGEERICEFIESIQGNFGDDAHVNEACGSGQDDDGSSVSDCDSETVGFNDVEASAMAMIEAKAALVTFKVTISNKSSLDALTIQSIETDYFGNVTLTSLLVESTTCGDNLETPLPPVGTVPEDSIYMCEFSAWVNELPFLDTLDVILKDDDAIPEGGNTLELLDISYDAEFEEVVDP